MCVFVSSVDLSVLEHRIFFSQAHQHLSKQWVRI